MYRDPNQPSLHARFPSTHWSVVLAANAETSSAGQRDAMEKLCQAYYEPLYGYARRRGSSPDEALDLTQGFFVHLIETSLFSKTDPDDGRLRTFLLVAFRHFVANVHAKACAQKRGGGKISIPLDLAVLEDRYCLAPRENDTPETLYERRWALNLMEQALAIVGESYRDSGRGDLFTALQDTLTGSANHRNYRDLAVQLGINEGAVKTAIHRLRRRFRTALRQTILETVSKPEDVDEEMRHLKAVIAS